MSFIEEKEVLDKRDLPEEFYRAIDIADYYDSELKVIKKGAFQFKNNPEGLKPEMDECSINWNDDEHAADVLKKNKYGYSKISIKDFSNKSFANAVLDLLKIKGIFDYARDSTEDNPYHGNLYIKSDVKGSRRELISHVLSSYASKDFIQNEIL